MMGIPSGNIRNSVFYHVHFFEVKITIGSMYGTVYMLTFGVY